MVDTPTKSPLFKLRVRRSQPMSESKDRVRELLELNHSLLDEYAKAHNCRIMGKAHDLSAAKAVQE